MSRRSLSPAVFLLLLGPALVAIPFLAHAATSNAPMVLSTARGVDVWTHGISLLGTIATVLGGMWLAVLKLRSGFYELGGQLRVELGGVKDDLIQRINAIETSVVRATGEVRTEVGGCVKDEECEARRVTYAAKQAETGERLATMLARLDGLQKSHDDNHRPVAHPSGEVRGG